MMIKAKVEKALNKQVSIELKAFYAYLSMAAYFEEFYMPGCAHWFKAQSQEEFAHAMRLNDYIVSRGGKVVLTQIDTPQASWKSFLAIFEDAYAQELKVSDQIHELMALAKAEHDYATSIMLQWFVMEQVEEEDTAHTHLEKLKLIKNDAHGLLIFDQELGQRT